MSNHNIQEIIFDIFYIETLIKIGIDEYLSISMMTSLCERKIYNLQR